MAFVILERSIAGEQEEKEYCVIPSMEVIGEFFLDGTKAWNGNRWEEAIAILTRPKFHQGVVPMPTRQNPLTHQLEGDLELGAEDIAAIQKAALNMVVGLNRQGCKTENIVVYASEGTKKYAVMLEGQDGGILRFASRGKLGFLGEEDRSVIGKDRQLHWTPVLEWEQESARVDPCPVKLEFAWVLTEKKAPKNKDCLGVMSAF